ncbi:MAG TPA: PKD domain-containing protein, partial [Candidatus Bathyarchaeia archaeon]|nr:PKD domain-containing protein [Candidatus Bathyarchaeia archaeon]
ANYIWFTPTDSHNMHDNSVSTGDAYLQNLLVGTGTIANPGSGSVLASSLFKSPGTFLYLWWDEYDPSPNVEYGSMIKVSFTSTGGYDEYDSLHTIEANWGLPYITSVVSADSGMTNIFGTVIPSRLSGSFAYVPTNPIVNTAVGFTAAATGGTAPYSYSWNFGDGVTGSGLTTTHTYSTVKSYNVTLTVTDAASGIAKSSLIVQIAPIPALTASFSFTPTHPTTGQMVTFSGNAAGGVSPYSFRWNFGDGSTSTSQSPTHTYSNSGTFTVGLNVTDSALTVATTSNSITVSPPGALTAAITPNPALPTSGQTVTFTATASGGTSPYSYSWNLGGSSKTGNPVSQSFTNGTYTITLTVTDSASKTATTSIQLTVRSSGGSTTVPVLIGWGGIRLDEAAVGGGINTPSNPPASLVFPGEKATNMELILIEMKAMGYNTVRVDFDPYCTDQSDFQYMSAYSATNLQRAIQIAQYFGFWIVVDYHGYSEAFNSSQESCWLNFWSGVTNQFKNSYSEIIWEPLNEPCYDPSTCAGASTTNDMCSGASACVPVLSSDYQAWIDQTRGQGDTHWIVVQNICSYGCSLSNWANGFPTVTDPLGTL